ncbi:MAG: type II toxin-antitoxin system HicB family antitoxin [Pseudomonadota bacterium]
MKRIRKLAKLAFGYICVFETNELGGYTVTCPKLPPVVTQGETLEEALAMAREAIELVLEVYRDEGTPIPPPDKPRRVRVREFAKVDRARS